MSSKRVYLDYLQDIRLNDFADNEEKVFAVVKTLEIIGEAARHVPKEWRDKYSGIPWKQVTGMRDKMTHEYFSVDVEVVWRTVQEDLPRLHDTAKQMLKDLADVEK